MARREAHFSRDIDLKSSTLELYSYASAKDKHQLFSNSRTSKMVRKTVIQQHSENIIRSFLAHSWIQFAGPH